ncbi:MAG: right-handed parallel beta-helix repeat-containing protein [Deltaproteobacteria bacterium]|nr:right-handed parallel beta-helix repeat-containing protein [Deltaproteobacteria bacterium]
MHCDNVQFYGSGWNNVIEGNFFNGGSTLILINGNDNGVIRNNVFKSVGSTPLDVQNACPSNTYPVLIEHNTFDGALLRVNYYCNAVIRNNAFRGGTYSTAGSVSCTDCVASYNVADTAVYGENSIQGTVIFQGGANPTTQAGYQLVAGSPGYRDGSDGHDRGTNDYGTVVEPPVPFLPVPRNLRISP